MEMTSGTPELFGSRRSRLCLVGGEAVEARCIKRRRRDPSAVAVCSNDQEGEQQQLNQSQQGDNQRQQTPTATTVKRSSRFRGVSRHRWTGRYEAHLWDKGSWNPTQRKKGKQVYLGAYDEEESAARAYDLAALKYWGPSTFTNFPVSDYDKELEIMRTVTKEEYLASLRRRSSGFSRGVSKYRGVARHHHNGRWEARIGRVFGNKYLYLGTYNTQEEAAHAYDIAAIEYRGINAVTNFDLSTYIRWLKPAGASYNLPFSPQEPKLVPEPLPMGSYSNQITREQTTQLPFSQANPYRNIIDDLNKPNPYRNIIDDLNKPITQDGISSGKSITTPSTKSSSPSALSLLLKSSVFKELVEKNSSTIEDEYETKTLPLIGNDEYAGHFSYLEDINFPYTDISALPSLDTKEANSLPLWYNK